MSLVSGRTLTVLSPLKDLKLLMWAVEVEFFPRYTFSPFSCLERMFSLFIAILVGICSIVMFS